MHIDIEILGKVAVLFLIRIILPITALLYLGDWIKQHQNNMEP